MNHLKKNTKKGKLKRMTTFLKIKNLIILLLTTFTTIISCNNSSEDLKKYFAFLGSSGSSDNPKIFSSVPANGDKNLPRSQKISILFDRPMNINSCLQAFSIQPSVRGFFDSDDTSIRFTPSTQLEQGTYTLNITKFCEDKNGRDLKEIFSINFTIGESTNAGTNPTVVSTSVFAGATSACSSGTATNTNFLNSDITNACMGNPARNRILIQFSKAMEKSITIASIATSPSFSGAFVWESDSLLRITPDLPLQFNQRYTINISTNAQDTNGQRLLIPSTSSFLVGTPDLIPTVNSVQVLSGTSANCALGAGTYTDILSTTVNTACLGNPTVNPIQIQFSVPMDTSVTQNSILISPTISGIYSWSASNTILTFTPSSPLQSGTTYTLTVNKSAQSVNSISLLASIVGSFIADPNAGNAILTSITIPQGTLANCNSGTGVNLDLLTNTITNACLGNPTNTQIVFNFAFPMNPTLTQQAVSFSPNIPGTFLWSGGNQILTFTANSLLDYGVQYSLILNQSAITASNVNLANTVVLQFVAGEIILTPRVQAFGVASQTGCPTTAPGIGSPTGGNWTLATSCYWQDTLAVLSPGNYIFRAGDNGTGLTGSSNACADVDTDNFRIIFNSYMDINSTISAISLKRLSPPLTTIALASWQWTDCAGTFPFGCRVVTLSFAEQEASCNGSLFGNATTGGDFNLLRTDNAPANLPYYQISVSNSAKTANGVFLTPFNFTMEGK
jgi:hypothetical protein